MGGFLIFLYAYGGKHKSAFLLAWRRRVRGVTAFFICHVSWFRLEGAAAVVATEAHFATVVIYTRKIFVYFKPER